MNALIEVHQPLTMSSREIAELVNSRHDNVKRSIERLSAEGIIRFTPSEETSHDGPGARPVEVYLLEKRDTYVVVAQLSPQFTARLVDRWQELEAAVAVPQFQIPQTLSEALRLAADQAETIERQAVQIEQQRPAVEFVDRYVQADGLKGFREVAKLLKANEARFREFLLGSGIMYVLCGKLTPYAPHLDAGRFIMRTGVSDANGHSFTQAKFTTKGVEYIAGRWAAWQMEEA